MTTPACCNIPSAHHCSNSKRGDEEEDATIVSVNTNVGGGCCSTNGSCTEKEHDRQEDLHDLSNGVS